MRFLVTGGAGFIGSHLVEQLLKDGHFVRALDNFSSGKFENLAFTGIHPSKAISRKNKGTIAHFELIRGDIRDKSTCREACKGIDYCLHQAALRSVPQSMRNPGDYNDVNINGTLFLLQAACKAKVKRFIFASSSSIYGDVDKFPEKEDFLPQLISPYALTKLAGEYYCRIFSEQFSLKTIALRYFNIFGPRQALDDEYALVIPKFIHCILHSQQPPIYGSGKQSRDFTYIDNVVQASILAVKTPLKKYEVFNVATGQDHTILELAKLLNRIVGKNIQPKFLPARVGDVFKTQADISKAKKILKFTPKVNFRQGLKKTIEYFKRKY